MKKSLVLIMLVAALVVVSVFGFAACSKNAYTIGVQSGTTGEYYVKGDVDWDFAGFANVKCNPFSNGGLAVQAMKNGTVNAVIIDEAPAKALAQRIEGIKVIDIALTTEEYAYGVDKAQSELLASINTILASTEFATKKAEIMNAYFGDGTPTPVSAATSADSSKAASQLVVATNAEFAPFEYKEGDKFLGVDMEIAAYLASQLGLELVIKDMDFESVVTSVGKDNVDIAMAGLTVNDVRKQSVNFTNSYYNASQMLVVLSTDTTFDDCKSAEDIEAKIKAL